MRVLEMKVVPRSSYEKIEEVTKDSYLVYVKSLPEKGRATKDALKILARHLHVPFAKLMLTKKDGLDVKTVVVLD